MRKDEARVRGVETSFLVPTMEYILRVLCRLSLYQWIFRLMKKVGKWPDEELIPFWFAEAYVVTPLLLLAAAFFFVPVGGWLWYVCLGVAGYRLFDLLQALGSYFVFDRQRRQDEQGYYILARHAIRWILLTLLNFVEIVLYFSFAYLTFSRSFNPAIDTRVGAIYQSSVTFLANPTSLPISDLARLVVILHVGYFVFFLVLVAPVIFSLIRTKEQTTEVLGKNLHPDKRL